MGECKWGTADARDLDRLIRRGRLVAQEAGGVTTTTPVLFTAGGLVPQAQAQVDAGVAVHVALEALYTVT